MNSQTFRFSRNPILFWFVSLPGYIWMIFLGQTKRLYHIFSIPELARTLFAPWKRDEVSTAQMSLGDKFQVWVGNQATRLIAFFIRSITIFVGFLTISLFFLSGIILIGIVILYPLVLILLIVLGVMQ